ncbi:hypothetical protein C943_01453 [Mariniradius saccharolyticus AK6]|uniref:Uncharacterized protein n=1 Tax=Mariniradius saccharolyticus AK6 TaxID=1239962 RepID=M7Y4K9_9BACT|nr:hypothetical protein C943_01453 [Mariniradius saccharolyticus AK6]
MQSAQKGKIARKDAKTPRIQRHVYHHHEPKPHSEEKIATNAKIPPTATEH